MPFAVGIGIITYNRKATVAATIERVRALTREPHAALMVADDGSSDGTLAMLREMRVPVVTGINMGIAWNKNRALFVLSQLLGCETVILLEDDTRPTAAGWESHWMTAARRWGHVNYAGDWMRSHFLSGAGTPDDPARATMVTAQCAAYSRDALTYAGYFDPRFTGYGHEHVEHTRRMIRLGYGGSVEQRNGTEQVIFHLITGAVAVVDSTSHGNAAAADRNLMLARQLMAEEGYRAPWGNDRQLRQFRSEAKSSFADDPMRFALHAAPLAAPAAAVAAVQPNRGLLARVWGAARG
jgi:glycosyltransferase involved in cell wall biosynthesis